VQNWLSFWNTLFWISLFIFFFNKTNFLDLLLFSEIVWVLLYILAVFYGTFTDDLNLYSLSFFLLALAGLEFSIGILLLVLFKSFRIDLIFSKNDNSSSQVLNSFQKPVFFNKLFLKK